MRYAVAAPVSLGDCLARLLAEASGRTRKQMLAGGRVRVNGTITRRADVALAAGDVVEVAAKGPRALNYSFYRNPRLDDVLGRASQLSSRVERARLYQRVQAMLGDDLPWLPIYVRLVWGVARPEVRNLRLHPTGFHRLQGVGLESLPGIQP